MRVAVGSMVGAGVSVGVGCRIGSGAEQAVSTRVRMIIMIREREDIGFQQVEILRVFRPLGFLRVLTLERFMDSFLR